MSLDVKTETLRKGRKLLLLNINEWCNKEPPDEGLIEAEDTYKAGTKVKVDKIAALIAHDNTPGKTISNILSCNRP